MINRAALLEARGDHRGAIRTYREALALRRKHFAESHPAIARTLAGLGFALLGSGAPDELVEAESLFRRALAAHVEALGPDHPSTLIIRRNLAAALLALGRSEEAEIQIREVLDRSFAVLDPDHWRLADARSVLGRCLLAQGRNDEARPLLVESYPIIRRVKGADSRYAQEARAWIDQL